MTLKEKKEEQPPREARELKTLHYTQENRFIIITFFIHLQNFKKDVLLPKDKLILRIVKSPLQVAGRKWTIFPCQYSSSVLKSKGVSRGFDQNPTEYFSRANWFTEFRWTCGAMAAFAAILTIMCSAIAHKSPSENTFE